MVPGRRRRRPISIRASRRLSTGWEARDECRDGRQEEAGDRRSGGILCDFCGVVSVLGAVWRDERASASSTARGVNDRTGRPERSEGCGARAGLGEEGRHDGRGTRSDAAHGSDAARRVAGVRGVGTEYLCARFSGRSVSPEDGEGELSGAASGGDRSTRASSYGATASSADQPEVFWHVDEQGRNQEGVSPEWRRCVRRLGGRCGTAPVSYFVDLCELDLGGGSAEQQQTGRCRWWVNEGRRRKTTEILAAPE